MFIFKQLKQKILARNSAQADPNNNKNVNKGLFKAEPAINVLSYQPDSITRMFSGTKSPGTGSGGLSQAVIMVSPNGVKSVKRIETKTDAKAKIVRRCKSSRSCECRNCRVLTEFTECGVCLEPLQGNGAYSCPVCANTVCQKCSLKLQKCAFCRSSQPYEKNRAVDRILANLKLPCKNSRWGCKSLLDGLTRSSHELACDFQMMQCPIGNNSCGWQGSVHQIQLHLKSAHQLQPVKDQGISVDIHSFRQKARATDGRVYTICLYCFDRLFVLRLIIYHGKLRVSLRQMGKITSNSPPESFKDSPNFGVWIGLRHLNGGGPRLRGLVTFSKHDRELHEVTYTCDEIYKKSSTSEDEGYASVGRVEDSDEGDDVVKVDFLVKQIEA